MMSHRTLGGRVRCSFALTMVTAVFAILPSSAGATVAESPSLRLTQYTTPTEVHPGAPYNEVQEVTVHATGGTFTLTKSDWLGPCGAKTTGELPYNATVAEVQEAFDGLCGSGRFVISGVPGAYTVEYIGESAGLRRALLTPDDSALVDGAGKGIVTVVEKREGQGHPIVVLTTTNVGGATTSGPITLEATVPAGLTVEEAYGYDAYNSPIAFNGKPLAPFSPYAATCSPGPKTVCTYTGSMMPGDMLVVSLVTSASNTVANGELVNATVSGGGGGEANLSDPLLVGTAHAPYGPAPGSVMAAVSSSQAGAHANVTTQFALSNSSSKTATKFPRDVRFDLPPGLVGSAKSMPQCEMHRVTIMLQESPSEYCPRDTMVGMAAITFPYKGGPEANPLLYSVTMPIYNVRPAPGEPAAFAFNALFSAVRLDTSVLSDGDYGVRVTAGGLTEEGETLRASITVWGVPAQHSGEGPGFGLGGGVSFGSPNPGQSERPLLTNPQQCAQPLVATMGTDPWDAPGTFESAAAPMGTLVGCLKVPFGSSFSFLPDTLEAGTPAGYTFDLNVPQNEDVGALATSSVREVHLTLPEGVVVNPSAAWGLKACSDLQFYGPGHPSQRPAFPNACPREAKVGEVEVETPDLEQPLKGDVLLGTPECDPCSPADAASGKMVRLFVQLQSQGESGIVVKLEGHALIDQSTGRITTVFKETPQLPFNHMRFVLEGGPRAVLANPRKCGSVKAVGDLNPWNSLLAIGEEGLVGDSTPSYEFEIDQNCFGSQFNPSFVAGSPNIQSGAYTPFTLSFGRSDNDEFLAGIKQTMPPGLLGNLSNVPLCKEPEAAQGTCGSGSAIGHVQVLTGPGADPFLVSGGQVFLTEGYEGAPYGLSIVVPAVAGPYTLSGTTGKGTVVVRAKIEVDPLTAALTVTSDPLPTVLDGIPLQLKAVNVTIDKPDFTFNPTSCAKMAIGATLSSSEGMGASKSSSFQVTNCASLDFKPSFSASTNGKTSRRDGASLTVKLSYPKAAFGSQANIRSVKVDLPRQLPSFLETLQHACPDSTFNQNPAACPAGSLVGSATATTPILPVQLVGPAYFVSHGGAKFPELVIVLSGYGTTVYLHGETFIKNGITSSTFRTIPDVPVESFQLTLPQGPNHALAANGNLCALTRVVTRRTRVRVKRHGRTRVTTRKVHKRIAAGLVMPTAFTAQNGMVIHQNTHIAVTGCAKHKPHRTHHNKHKHHKKK